MNNHYKIKFNSTARAALLFIIILTAVSGCSQRKSDRIVLGTLTVDAGSANRVNTPISFQCLPKDIFCDPAKFRRDGFFHYIGDAADISLLRDNHLVLIEEGAHSPVNVQWAAESDFDWERVAGTGALVWLLNGKTPQGTQRKFTLVLEKGPAPSGLFKVEDIDRKHLMVKSGDTPVLRYNYGMMHEKEGVSGPNDRSSYIHPVWTPSGKIVTGDFSPEHIHQRGIFDAWQKIKFNDVILNFWELGSEPGRKVTDELGPSVIEGPVFTELDIFNKSVYNERTLMRELCVIRIFGVPEEPGWLFDIQVRQIPVDPNNPQKLSKGAGAADSISMEVLQNSYGGMAFRGAGEWLPENVILDILTSEGKNRIDGNDTEARWVDYTGPLGSGWGGLVMFDHPLNQRYPTPVRIHPKLPYFCFNYTKNGPGTVTMDKPLVRQYRFFIHDGHPDKELNDRIARDFVEPPSVTWERKN
ncbi:MAG: PmoA family protein [Patescibacteria group bacterium]|nr:PmoA family protein [Patescibacteria group bacterium]